MDYLRYSKEDRSYIEKHNIRFPEFDFFKDNSVYAIDQEKKSELRLVLDFFNDDRFDENLKECLRSVPVVKPQPIQAVCINQICDGMDLIGVSKTGSGKTFAFGIPLILRYKGFENTYDNQDEKKVGRPKVLILAPTRELAIQVSEAISFIASDSVSIYCVYGGTDRIQQIRDLRNINPVIIVATPGRFKDFLDNKVFTTDGIEILILDEADRMLDKGFFPDVEYILKYLPKNRQIILFSATWNQDLQEIVKANMNLENLFKVSIGSVLNEVNKDILQIPIVIGDFQRLYFLTHLLKKTYCGFKILVFFNRTETVDRMVELFQGEKIAPAFAFSSKVAQDKREYLIGRFRQGAIRILFATDAVSRGLDIDDVHVVINYDFPVNVDTYTHRIGRTGRNGKYGQAISFVSPTFRSHKNFHDFMELLKHGSVIWPPEFNEYPKNSTNYSDDDHYDSE